MGRQAGIAPPSWNTGRGATAPSRSYTTGGSSYSGRAPAISSMRGGFGGGGTFGNVARSPAFSGGGAGGGARSGGFGGAGFSGGGGGHGGGGGRR